MTFVFDLKYFNHVSVDDVEQALITQDSEFHGIFGQVATGIKRENPKLIPCLITARLSSKKLRINDIPVSSILFHANFESQTQAYNIPSVVTYDTPETDALHRNVYIEQVELGQFEIMQSTDNVSVALDLSEIHMPKNCQFHTVNFEFTRSVSMDSIYMIGLPELGIPLSNFEIGVKFE